MTKDKNIITSFEFHMMDIIYLTSKPPAFRPLQNFRSLQSVYIVILTLELSEASLRGDQYSNVNSNIFDGVGQ